MASAGWKAAKWVIKKSIDVVPPAYLALRHVLDHEEDVPEPGWHRFVVRFSRKTPAGFPEDYAQMKFDLIKIADGGGDNSWTGPEFTAIATALDTMMGQVTTLQSNTHTCVEYRAYRMRYNPDDPGPGGGPANPQRPFQDTGPPVYVLTKSLPGSASVIMPYQVAATVTFRTAFPKHWGRAYVPGIAPTLDANGRLPNGFRLTLANAFFDFQDDVTAAGFLHAVPMVQFDKQRFHGLAGVTQLVVDDIPDVIRRRRPKLVAARTIGVE